MTSERQLELTLERWLADGIDEMPDRVYYAVLDRVDRQPQRWAWRLLPWRIPVSTPLKLILIGAALVAALAAGAVLIGGGSRITGPAPTPSPFALKEGPLTPGTYRVGPVDGNPTTWTVTVPDGWRAYQDWAIIGPEMPGNKGTALFLAEKVGIPDDSCHPVGTPPAATVDDLIADIQSRDDWTVSAPVDITVGGYTGRRIDIELPANVSTCGSNDDYFVTTEDGRQGWYAQAPSNRFTFWALDVAGTPRVLMRSSFADVPAREITETDAMVASSVITP